MRKFVLLMIVLAVSLVGCAHKKTNPWKAYEGKTSAEIFHQGERHLVKKKYARAITDFQALNALYPFGPYSKQGQMDIIYAYYMNDDNASGLASADRYLRLYPQDPHIDYVYYMKGRMSFEGGFNWYQRLFGMDPAPHDLSSKRESFVAFNQVVRLYPKSIYAPNAALHMAFIRNMMARKQIAIAKFYKDRKAYVAAANRAMDVVQHYSGTPVMPEALAILAESYQKVGVIDLANDSYRILQASYPDSDAFKKLSKTFVQESVIASEAKQSSD